jgi:DNA-binding LacI/PurR family transcriptional regulator
MSQGPGNRSDSGASVTISDVARRAGVSKGAVSFALNGRPGVSNGTRERILRAAEELSWRPSVRARALSESRALAVGLILTCPPEHLASDPYVGHLLAGVEASLATAGYALVLIVVRDATSEAEAYGRLVRDGRIDGVLLTDPRIDDPRYALVTELGLEAVVIGHPDPSVPLPAVAAVERDAIAHAMRALVDAGHERIAHVSGPRQLIHSAERQSAWQEALLELGLTPGKVAEGDFTAEGGARATRRLLVRRPRPTAIFYANDLMAISGLRAARELGVDVPRQLSVVGFDDIPLAGHVHPRLTTIRQDPMAAGAAAASLLLACLRGERPAAPVLPAAALKIRESIAPAPSGHSTSSRSRG